MSKLSRLSSGKSIVPGVQVVNVISAAAPHGNAAQVLRAVARNYSGSRISWEFPHGWQEKHGIVSSCGTVRFGKNEYALTLRIGTEEGLVLKDVEGLGRSLKSSRGACCLEIGSKVSARQLESYARNLLNSWVVHGCEWLNRREEMVPNPYGFERRNRLPDYFFFDVVDGTKKPMTLQELIETGCVRSTHVGQWTNRHSTLIAAACDMPLTLHEFKKGGEDVCVWKEVVIGKNADVWGGYAEWNEDGRRCKALDMWQELALACSSPFAFHVHATRLLFPKARLDSDHLLEAAGRGVLTAALELMAQKDPDRFYRLIDERGQTHKLVGVANDYLVFANDDHISRNSIAANVLATFDHLQYLQNDCRFLLPRVKRLVIDPHAYIVLTALAARQKSVYALSGRDMHRYLTEGGSSAMHKIRNERLFLLLRQLFGVTSVQFNVYPPLKIESGLISQYHDLRGAPKAEWLSHTV